MSSVSEHMSNYTHSKDYIASHLPDEEEKLSTVVEELEDIHYISKKQIL